MASNTNTRPVHHPFIDEILTSKRMSPKCFRLLGTFVEPLFIMYQWYSRKFFINFNTGSAEYDIF